MPDSFPNNPISLGSILVSPALVLAPLHEITDFAFRRLLRSLGGVGLTVTEMISSEALTRHALKAERMLEAEGEHPYAVQLVGQDPIRMTEAALIAQNHGCDLVDLNLGCPAHHVTSGGAGSALMRDLKRTQSLIQSMKGALSIPLTVKIRAGWDDNQKRQGVLFEFLRMFEAQGVAAVTIHPRTRTQQYSGQADWSLIGRAVEAGHPFPIIGNGDVRTAGDAHRMVQETGCAGVMIGRAALSNPWIFRQVLEPDFQIGEKERIDLCLDFFRLLQARREPREALHKMKKLGSWFTKGISGGAHFRQQLNAVHEVQALMELLESLKNAIPLHGREI